ncbi:hypothetical protein [Sphingomonas sp. GB1N7]|uniref:hypothetical protein n=1 Tax=Parasphingomonas caseinilytica TaxID=3096158 RepID=UPI002FC5C114
MKQLAMCMSFILTGEALPPPTSTVTQDFCSRLAANSGIDKPSSSEGPTEWTVRAMNFGQRFIVGGSAATGVGVKPVEPATVEDYRRLENMCMPEGKGAICKLVGPLNFNFIWKGRKIVTPMEVGERATIWVAGIKTTCRSEAAQ